VWANTFLASMNLVARVHALGLQFGQHLRVVHGVDHHRHVLPVLGRGAQHGRAADVDVLDGVFQRAVGLGGGLREGVQVDHQQVDGADAVFLASAAMCSGRSRRASRPPCMRGCRVLTRPSSISGKPVTSDTSVTGRPASASSLAVPPVDSRRTPWACSALGKFDDAGLVGHGQQGGEAMVLPSVQSGVYLISLWSSSLRRSVLRLMPSQSAALLWLPSAQHHHFQHAASPPR
jgi:hypothetical protein